MCAEFVPSKGLFVSSAHSYFYRSMTGVPNSAESHFLFKHFIAFWWLQVWHPPSWILSAVDS